MRLGLVHVNMGSLSRPDELVAAARAAEAAGFDSVWGGEHVVLPDPQVPPSPMAPQDPALDPLFALTWAAAHTTTIRLATGIVILPQRNPLVLAKEVATLDVLSGGRVMLGVGAGYLEPEFHAIGANFAERGAVTDEYLDVLQSLWYDEHPEYHGRFADFAGIDAQPRPVQRPIPLVVGGHSPPAYRRAVAQGPRLVRILAHPRRRRRLSRWPARRRRSGRATRRVLGELEISVTPRGHLTPERAAAFADAGVDRLVVLSTPPSSPVETVEGARAAIAQL